MYRQPTLFGDAPPSVDTEFADLTRHRVDQATWIDHAPMWLAGADTVFDQLVDRVAWRQREVTMYGRILPEPRLSAWWTRRHGPIPLPFLDEIGTALDQRYGVTFSSIGFNWYRTGADSVAWHADTKGSTDLDHLPPRRQSLTSSRDTRLGPRVGVRPCQRSARGTSAAQKP